ncbi:MAG: VRR-NUC domain-containing protein, partial [Gammaproteobacteria bacterium]|nr:VRR-NUC domain-containing protein [Gammaproteobacteria bacterium]
LGLYQYENYCIDFDNRPYRNAEEIQTHWLLHQLEIYLELIDATDQKILLDCFAGIPDCAEQQSTLFRKSDRLRFKIARQLERIGNLDAAMKLYLQCLLPPSRERQARIYHQQKNIESAMTICQQIIDDPIDDAEYQFANEFASRLIRQHKLVPRAGIESVQNYQPEILQLELIKQSAVELAVVEYYLQQQPEQQCFYLENSLFNSVFGLLIWDAIFAPLAGAFYNPFQYRPGDFYAHDFVKKRQQYFDSIWLSIKTNDDIWQRAQDCWRLKQGIANPLVDWTHINLDIIELALQRIPHDHWLKIFERLLTDLRNNRSGFPDLIVFPPENGYLLVEVKGPGDSLQKNQQRWMQYFAENNIPHLLARVNWRVED